MDFVSRRSAAGAALFFVLLAWGPVTKGLERQFQESAAPVRNPDCGWVAYNYEDSYELRRRAAGGKEPFEYATVIYTRHPAASWETAQGSYAGSPPLQLLQDWMAHGRNVALRVYANRPEHLPATLRQNPPLLDSGGGGERLLDYMDEAYFREHAHLVRWLGEKLSDNPRLSFVDVGGVGNTGGEWVFSNVRAYREAGLDDDAMYELVKRYVELYREAFPHTRLFIAYDSIPYADSRRADIIALLKEHNVGLRDDGLGGWPYPRMYPPVTAWPMPGLWRDLPVTFEGGGKGGGVYGWMVQENREPEEVLRWAFRQVGPTHINLAGSETGSQAACDQIGELLTEYGRRLGYRFALLHVELPTELRRGRAAQVSMRWANRGAAPCYVDRAIRFYFIGDDGRIAATADMHPTPATSDWRPDSEVEVRGELVVPATLDLTDYGLKVAMLFGDLREPAQTVRIATEEADERGVCSLGKVTVQRW